jgi:hypothetical protein
MFWQRVSSALLAGTFVAMASLSARAEDEPRAPAPAPAPAPAAAPAAADPCAPQYRTICCTEWVPEKVQVERTVMKYEMRQEKYTAYECKCVQEKRMVTRCVTERVPVTKCVTVCEKVNCCEERTVMQTRTCCKPVCKTVRKCVDKGHYECRCVECKPGFLERMHHKKDCCDPCGGNACCEEKKYKTEKVWVPCPVWEEHQVTCMQKVTECVPVKCKVNVCKTVQVQKQVTVCECRTKQVCEEVCCNVMKKVPVECTRCVRVCVPCKEMVTECRMVKKTVMKQVPCEPAPCCEPCCPSRKHSFFGGHGGGHGCGSNDCCQ